MRVAASFHEYGFFFVVRSLLMVQGPFSANRAISDEQPGPPVIHKITGSVAGLPRDSNAQ